MYNYKAMINMDINNFLRILILELIRISVKESKEERNSLETFILKYYILNKLYSSSSFHSSFSFYFIFLSLCE